MIPAGGDLDRTLTRKEYDDAIQAAREAGIHRLDRPRRYSLF